MTDTIEIKAIKNEYNNEAVLIKYLGSDGGLLTPVVPWYLVNNNGAISLVYCDTDGRIYEEEDLDEYNRVVIEGRFSL